MEKRSRWTRHGYRENRTNCPGDRFPVPASSPTTRKSSPSANEKQSRPHWRNATVEFQARRARPPSSEFPTNPCLKDREPRYRQASVQSAPLEASIDLGPRIALPRIQRKASDLPAY